MLRLIRLPIVLSLLVWPLLGQGPGAGKEALSKAVHEVNGLVKKLAALQKQAVAAREFTEAVGGAEGVADEVREAADELGQQVAVLQVSIRQVQSALEKTRDKAAKLAPAEVVRELEAASQRFEAATRKRKLEDAEAGYRAVAKELGKPLFTGSEQARRLMVYSKFRVAEMVRSRALLQMKKRGSDRQAERTLLDAAKLFEKVLEHDDVLQVEEGSSLHAVALHRIIAIEGSFFERYTRMSRDPRVRGREKKVRQRADQHREKAETLYEEMRRMHPQDVDASGRRIVDVVRTEMAAIFR